MIVERLWIDTHNIEGGIHKSQHQYFLNKHDEKMGKTISELKKQNIS